MTKSYLEQLLEAAQSGYGNLSDALYNAYDEAQAIGSGFAREVSRPEMFRQETGQPSPSIDNTEEGFRDLAYLLSSPGRALDRAVSYYSGGTPLFPEGNMMSGSYTEPSNQNLTSPIFAGISPEELAKSEAKKVDAETDLLAKRGEVMDAQIASIRRRLEDLQVDSKLTPDSDTFVSVGNSIVRGGGKELFGGKGSFSRSRKPISDKSDNEPTSLPREISDALGAQQQEEEALRNRMDMLLFKFENSKDPQAKEDAATQIQLLQRLPQPGRTRLETTLSLNPKQESINSQIDSVLRDIDDPSKLPQAVARLRNMGLSDDDISIVLASYLPKNK